MRCIITFYAKRSCNALEYNRIKMGLIYISSYTIYSIDQYTLIYVYSIAEYSIEDTILSTSLLIYCKKLDLEVLIE